MPTDYLSSDKNTLYFIGNGFDLFHGLKTKFIHFYSWLNLEDEEHEQFVMDMENIFSQSGVHGNLLWTDFEKALGRCDIQNVHTAYAGKEDTIIYDTDFQQRAGRYVHSVFDKIPIYLKEWAMQIDTKSIKQKLILGKSSQYLTFNYTHILEDVYQIAPSQIWHVHGDVKGNSPLITGHNNGYHKYYDEIGSDNIRKSYEAISEEVQSLYKPVDNIIKMSKDYFCTLNHINKVIVFGHSLSVIDMPYFKQVVYNVQDDTRWFFVVHDDNAKNRYTDIVTSLSDLFDFNKTRAVCLGQYQNKIKAENCKYINIKDIIL